MKQQVAMNKLLASLPPEEFASIAMDLEQVTLRRGQHLYRYGELISHVFFPITTVVSLVTILPDGKSSEIGMVGPEGAVGLSLILGPDVTVHTAEILVPGQALRVRAEVLKKNYEVKETLRLQVRLQLWLLLAQFSRIAVCNLCHQIPERISRWLLTLQDRSGADEFYVTHEKIAERLSIRRSGVTIQLGTLEKLGAIESGRRKIKIICRDILEKGACECYTRLAQETKWATCLQGAQELRKPIPSSYPRIQHLRLE
jgi:CRP-like cAMP-binding protein